MSADDQARWNEKYLHGSHSWETPDDFLAEAYERFLAGTTPGRALDVAGGAGRHSLWLAERGWQVDLVDVSDVGTALARQKANAASVIIHTKVLDLGEATSADLGGEQYDLIVIFFYLRRQLFPAILSALKPGGCLIYKTYTIAQLQFDKGPRDAEFLLQPDELRQAFGQMEILHYREAVAAGKAVVELVGKIS
jgi:SAM-dependent methyltransferase